MSKRTHEQRIALFELSEFLADDEEEREISPGLAAALIEELRGNYGLAVRVAEAIEEARLELQDMRGFMSPLVSKKKGKKGKNEPDESVEPGICDEPFFQEIQEQARRSIDERKDYK